MTTDTLAEQFRDQLGERVTDTRIAYDQLTVTVAPQSFVQVARFCKDELGMTFFDFLSAIDEREAGFSVMARVYSHVKRQGVILKTPVPGGRDEPRLGTITGVYAGANWHERETYDMFGIIFEGHPGLLPRILTVENFEGWPLRKEFRLVSRDVKPWPGAKEPGGSDEEDATAKPAAAGAAPGGAPEDRAAAAKAKAERAKAKAAEARKRKAAERAAAAGTAPAQTAAEAVTTDGTAGDPKASDGASAEGHAIAGTSAEGEDGGHGVATTGVTEAAEATTTPDATIDDAEPGSAREAMAAAAGRDVPAGTPDPTEPEGAAEIAGTPIAKDAAAGVRDGDSAGTAPGDPIDSDQPVRDAAKERAMGEGGPPQDSGTPGVEAQGVTDLEDSSSRHDQGDPDEEATDDE